jgi:hypothetical protein
VVKGGNGKNLNAELIAPCGMNCGLCSSYLALTNDLKSKGVKMSYCTGCRARNKQCAFLKKSCSRLLKGEVKFCFECPEFPCEQLKKLDEKYKTRYRMSMINNSRFIKEHGMQKFLSEQEKTWKCPTCNGIVSCHNGLCFNCDLEKLRSKKKKYRWDE